MEIATVEGKWDAFAQGIIKILNSENQEVFLQSENNTVLQYSAEAEPSWLMPGYMVRFSATFDQNSKATAPLKAIEVFTPVTHRHMTPEAMREQTPGIYREDKAQAGEAKGMFGNEGNNNATKNNANKNNVNNVNNKAQSKSKPSKKESAIAPGQTMRVVGQLGNIQGNVLTVIAMSPMQIEIDPKAVVTVTASDLSFAYPMVVKGDKVTASGLRNPAQPSQIYCEKITIKAASKLTQAMPQTKRGKASTRDKDGDAKSSKEAKDTSKSKIEPKKPNTSEKKPN